MNQPFSSTRALGVEVPGGSRILGQGQPPLLAESDEDFQKLLLRLCSTAAERTEPSALIEFFCRAAFEFFNVSGVYFWRSVSADELVGEQAYGKMSDRFPGLRMRAEESAVASQAVRQRRTVVVNQLNAAVFPAAMEFEARSIMAAPLVV